MLLAIFSGVVHSLNKSHIPNLGSFLPQTITGLAVIITKVRVHALYRRHLLVTVMSRFVRCIS